MVNHRFGHRTVCSLLSLLVVLSSLVLILPEVSFPATGMEFSKPNVKVDQTSIIPRYPSIAVDDQGILHAVWEDNRSGWSGIYYSNSTDSGLTWSPEVVISFQSPGHVYFNPKIAVDMNSPSYKGSIYVVYEKLLDGFSIWISYSHDRGKSWNHAQVDHGGILVRSEQPAIAVADNGTIYVAWKDGRTPIYQIFVSASYDGGLAWTPDVRVSTTDEWNVLPSIATHGSSVYVAWQEFHDIYYASVCFAYSSDGVSWSNVDRVAETGTYRLLRLDPDIKVDPNGAVLLVWALREQDGDWMIEFSRSDDNGLAWSSPVRVDHGGSSVKDVRALGMSLGGGNIYVAWSYEVWSDESIYFTYSADGGRTWGDKGKSSQDVRVDDTRGNGDPNDDYTPQRYPAIASTDYRVFVIWMDKRSLTSWHLYFAETTISFLQITEIRDSPDGQEAIEIFNYGGESWDMVDTSLWIEGEPKTDLSALGIIPAGEYRTIGDIASMDLTVDITLGDEGGLLALLDGMKVLDLVGYGQKGTTPDPLTGESVARHSDGLRYSFDWVRESSPTLGSQNNVPIVDRNPTLVLNEVLFNPLLPSDGFVEIMLIDGEQIDTNGYLLVCDSVHALNSITLTKENPMYSILQSDDPPFFSTITSSGDNVYLYDPAGQLMDMVGWSTSHTPGLSVARVPEGNGTYDGYDDDSSIDAGWDFDVTPTPSVVSIGPDQWKNGELGEDVSYELTVANRGSGADYIDITYASTPNGWNVGIFHVDGVTPLTDSPADGDGIPDIGILGSFRDKKIIVKVTIPLAPQAGAYENTTIYATSSNNPSLYGEALLVTRPYPSIAVNKSIFPREVYIETAGPEYQKETTITLEVKGTGSSVFFDTPQDVMFLIDMSNSIGYTNFTLEKKLALTYLKQMRHPDRAAVVFFEGVPVFKRPPSENYEEVEADIRSEPNVKTEPTYLGRALNETAHYLFNYGNRNHSKMIFLFTDGFDCKGCLNNPNPLVIANWCALHNISIYPFGVRGDLGEPEESLLKKIADITGTRYVFVNSSQVMDGLRDEIGLIEKSVAVYDPDPDDFVPLIQDVLPDYIHYVPGSFVDPDTGRARNPSIAEKSGLTYLMWEVSHIHVKDGWSVSFRITCARTGHNLANIYDDPTDTRVMGSSWNDSLIIIPFPEVYVDCLSPVLKPYGVSARLEGPSFGDVNITWNLSPADPEGVDYYEIYHGTEFDPSGSSYTTLGTTPAGRSYYLAVGLGEGDSNNYFFRLCAVSPFGERACADNQAAKFTRPLSKGPNLISIPLIQSNGSIERVLQTVEFDKAWFYDSSSQEWKSFMKDKTYKGELWNMNRTMGLWINVTEDSNLTVAGTVPSQTMIHLHEGWNLVGFPSFDSTYSISDLNTEVGSTRVEGFDSLPHYHLRVLGDAEVLLPGYGYWVKVDADVDWIVEVS